MKYILCLVFISVSFAQSPAEFTGDYYEDVKKVTLAVLAECPPDDCLIVGVGRSPVPITMMANELAPNSAINFPISQLRSNPHKIHQDVADKVQAQIEQRKVHSLMEEFITSKRAKNVKKVLVLDFISTGESIVSFHAHLEDYMKVIDADTEVKSFGLVRDENTQFYKYAKEFKVKNMVTYPLKSNTKLYKGMSYSLFEDYAEYDRNAISEDSKPIKNDPTLRDEMRANMKEAIRKDPEFDGGYDASKFKGRVNQTKCLNNMKMTKEFILDAIF
jgi:hypothetical protein